MRIVWLSGWAGSGKDTVAEILCKKLGYFRVAFADILKDYVSVKYGFERGLCDTYEGKKTVLSNGKTIRELLIQESAEAKTTNINVFAKQAGVKILASYQPLIVISDWRYEHEYNFIKSMVLPSTEHITIRLTRPGLGSLSDPSEHALDNFPFDYHLINNHLRSLEKDIVAYLKNQ